MSANILGFFGEYRFLSNFYPVVVQRNRVNYPSVEHAYQASKFLDLDLRKRVAGAKTAAKSKKVAYQLPAEFRGDWEQVKERIMLKLLRRKFKDPKLRALLLATGDAYLEETNTWGDVYWGVCRGKGQNRLGKLLMQVRKELQ